MNIPLIVDIAIGLIFIYLILSLLASEIQELITTVLQWRAKHLKESIESMLAGNNLPDEVEGVKTLTADLYNNPLIGSANHQAQGLLANFFRSITQSIGFIYNQITGTPNHFGNATTGPSYLAAETFATSLLNTIKIPQIVDNLFLTRLQKFEVEKLQEVQSVIDSLEMSDETRAYLNYEYENLSKKFADIVDDYKNQRSDLSTSIDRMAEQLNIYIESCQVYFPASEITAKIFVNRMNSIKFISNSEKTALLGGWKPSLTDMLEEIRSNRRVYLEIKNITEDKDSAFYQGIENVINGLPKPVKDNLDILVNRSQMKIQNVENGLNQLKQEIETWFDRSMERASGVYKRNAKGVAILLGCFIAVGANADTIYIVNRLSKDSVLRSTITQYGNVVVTENPDKNTNDFGPVKAKVEEALQQVALPIGWGSDNIKNQEEYASKDIPFVAGLRRTFGWAITGLAVSMGAKFWFDLLGKIIDVRNAGKKPDKS